MAAMTPRRLTNIAHRHGHHLAAFELERWRRRAGLDQCPDDLSDELVRLYWAERRFTNSDWIITAGDTVISDGYEEANRQPDQRRMGRWLMKTGTIGSFTVDLSANGPKPFKTQADIDKAQRRLQRLLAKHRKTALSVSGAACDSSPGAARGAADRYSSE